MSNMSYCRFQNTKNDLEDCVNVLMGESEHYQNVNKLSREEKRAYENMKELCEQFLSYCDEFETRELNEQEEE